MDMQKFTNPPAEFRSVPFWSLNEWLDTDEIKRQMGEFARGGYGGAYLHSRIGLQTLYLGDDWWRAMDAGVEVAKEHDIEAWFYDEDRWPSGFAGGEVPQADEAFRSRCLIRQAKDKPLPERSDVLAEDEKYRYLCYRVRMGDPWHNGTCWVDLLNPDTVAKFIECSYKPYAERYADEIGKSVHGIFTDEPQVRAVTDDVEHDGAIAFSPILLEDFRREHGYDLLSKVGELFEAAGDYRRTRLHYLRTLARRFEKSFSEQIGQYCDNHGLVWTGHYNGEENFHSAARNVGNMMIQYRHMQRPGVDWLALHIDDGLNTLKSLSSVANQYGRQRRLSEMFGISGQNMNFEDRKWIADFHAVLGVNHVCPHLSLFALAGCRKRDYPPTLSPQQPWWQFNGHLEDHLARVSYATTVGDFAAEALVIHPIESAYTEYPEHVRVDVDGKEATLYEAYDGVMQRLAENHRDFDLGDEQILADDAKVEGDRLVVGRMSYPAVILPHVQTIRKSTLELLTEFAQAGGAVLAVGQRPTMLEAEPAEGVLDGVAKVVAPSEIVDALAEANPPAVVIEGEGAAEVWTHRRVSDNGQLVILTNLSRKHDAHVTVRLAEVEGKTLSLLNPDNGQKLAIAGSDRGEVTLHFAPAQTWILVTGSIAADVDYAGEYRLPGSDKVILPLAGNWQAKRLDENAITLDFARPSVDGAAFGEPEPVIAIHEQLMMDEYEGPLALAYDVEIEVVPAQAELVVEYPQMYDAITVNGQAVEFGQAFYRDYTFRRTDVAGLLQAGTNTIELRLGFIPPAPASPTKVAGTAAAGSEGGEVTPLWEIEPERRYGTEIESIYLIGEFGVRAETSPEPPHETHRSQRGFLPEMPIHRFRSFALVEELAEVEGDLTPQGYPFYAGRFELAKRFTLPEKLPNRRYLLRWPKLEAQVVIASVNGHAQPFVAWSPWEVDITDAVVAGENELTLVLVNSLRNLLGPHHHRDGELLGVGPGSFTGRSTWCSGGPGDDDWVEKRRRGEPCKIWRDDYHCIPFGMLQPPEIIVRQ